MKLPGRSVERAFWSSRLMALVAVIFGVLLSLGAFYLATVDVFYALRYFAVQYADPSSAAGEHRELRADAVTIIKAVDGYLIGAILLICADGHYEPFIRKLGATERSESAPRLLPVRSLAQLKGQTTSLILLVLAIAFLRRALALSYESALGLCSASRPAFCSLAWHSISAPKASSGKWPKAGG